MQNWPENYLPDIAAAQATQFMCDLLPYIQRSLRRGNSSGKPLHVLDVGCGCGAGSELLRLLHNPAAYSDLHFQVTAIDSSPRFAEWTRSRYPRLDFHVASAQDWYDGALHPLYDLVVSSHCIEHTPEPRHFLKLLRLMSHGQVLLACPYDEPDPLHAEHLSRIDWEFIEQTRPAEIEIYHSAAWSISPCAILCYDPL